MDSHNFTSSFEGADNERGRYFFVSITAASAHSRMDTAINYAFWAIAALMAGGLVLAMLVW